MKFLEKKFKNEDLEIVSEIRDGYYLLYTDKKEIYDVFNKNKIKPSQFYYKKGKLIGQGYIVKKELIKK